MYKRAQKWILCGSDDDLSSEDEEETVKMQNLMSRMHKEMLSQRNSCFNQQEIDKLPSKIPKRLVVKSILLYKKENPEKIFKISKQTVVRTILKEKKSSKQRRVCQMRVHIKRKIQNKNEKKKLSVH